MELLDLTLATPRDNLDMEENLLDTLESEVEIFRMWEATEPIVVLGRSSQLETEVKVAECIKLNTPILRRVSGGAAIVAGPGCLMYAAMVSLEKRPELVMVDRAHAWVLDQFVQALRPIVPNVSCAGTSDLALLPVDAIAPDGTCAKADYRARKFSGNSMRKKRTRILYHGAIMYSFDLSLIDRYLHMPPRQPGYRLNREHADFVTNLPMDGEKLRETIAKHWEQV